MGLKYALDFVQQIMEQVPCGFNNVQVYLDDIGIFSKTWIGHQIVLDKVLSHLEAFGFTTNHLKCAWGIQEMD